MFLAAVPALVAAGRLTGFSTNPLQEAVDAIDPQSGRAVQNLRATAHNLRAISDHAAVYAPVAFPVAFVGMLVVLALLVLQLGREVLPSAESPEQQLLDSSGAQLMAWGVVVPALQCLTVAVCQGLAVPMFRAGQNEHIATGTLPPWYQAGRAANQLHRWLRGFPGQTTNMGHITWRGNSSPWISWAALDVHMWCYPVGQYTSNSRRVRPRVYYQMTAGIAVVAMVLALGWLQRLCICAAVAGLIAAMLAKAVPMWVQPAGRPAQQRILGADVWVFELALEWPDGRTTAVRRRFADFKWLHGALLPDLEAANRPPELRTLPTAGMGMGMGMGNLSEADAAERGRKVAAWLRRLFLEPEFSRRPELRDIFCDANVPVSECAAAWARFENGCPVPVAMQCAERAICTAVPAFTGRGLDLTGGLDLASVLNELMQIDRTLAVGDRATADGFTGRHIMGYLKQHGIPFFAATQQQFQRHRAQLRDMVAIFSTGACEMQQRGALVCGCTSDGRGNTRHWSADRRLRDRGQAFVFLGVQPAGLNLVGPSEDPANQPQTEGMRQRGLTVAAEAQAAPPMERPQPPTARAPAQTAAPDVAAGSDARRSSYSDAPPASRSRSSSWGAAGSNLASAFRAGYRGELRSRPTAGSAPRPGSPTRGTPPVHVPQPQPLAALGALGESFDMVEVPGAGSTARVSTISTREADNAEVALEATVYRRQ